MEDFFITHKRIQKYIKISKKLLTKVDLKYHSKKPIGVPNLLYLKWNNSSIMNDQV